MRGRALALAAVLALARRLPAVHWRAVRPLSFCRIDLLAVTALEEATGRASCLPVPVAVILRGLETDPALFLRNQEAV